MIYKVFYQDLPDEIPVRERTESLYVEAESEREVRDKLYDRNYEINIEYIQPLTEAHLNYEKQSDQFELETV
ncbi:DNA-dependent RNA polymerase subunit epsilon [Lentibacillus juripiscarius]|uniref:DNA-directed RNA polymerase subunit epsilon n=1 Tax=Lentibacillus juripiscarius TaxID=257446 RepID=A0ABW5V6Z5_9BACI